MRTKVHDGTPKHDNGSLCRSCRNGSVIRGERLDQELIVCSALGVEGERITFKVTHCTEYADQNQPSQYELEKIAWRIDTDRKTGKIGFMSPKEWKKAQAASGDFDD